MVGDLVGTAAVRVETGGPVARLVLDRPARRNALSLSVMQSLIAGLDTIASDREARVVVLEGAGPAFSAGHDIAEMVAPVETNRDAFYRELFATCVTLMERLHSVPQPVIAKVHGVATAAGCQLVAACDLAVATEEARFATPGVNIGLFCSTPMVAVSRSIGRKRALEMLLTGEMIDAATALAWGLVNRVVPADRLDDETNTLAVRIERVEPRRDRAREARLLRAGGERRVRRVRPRVWVHGRERAVRRCAGRHAGLPREAGAALVRRLRARGVT